MPQLNCTTNMEIVKLNRGRERKNMFYENRVTMRLKLAVKLIETRKDVKEH